MYVFVLVFYFFSCRYIYETSGIVLTHVGENMIHSISVRGDEFNSHCSVVVSLDVPYAQITSVNFATTNGDLDETRYQVAGNLILVQGDSISSATIFSGYWGTTKLEFYNGTYAEPIFTQAASSVAISVAAIIPPETEFPVGVTHILVTASNLIGENRTGATYLRLYDNTGNPGDLPNATAFDVDMVDMDTERGTVSGTLKIHSAIDTTTVQFYNVYWGSNATNPME